MVKSKSVLVTGDVVLDYFLYKGKRLSPDSTEQGGFLVKQVGGAALLYDILTKTIQKLGKAREVKASLGMDRNYQDFPEKLKSYSAWRPSSDIDKKSNPVWALDEFFGYGPNYDASAFDPARLFLKATDTPNILVLDDAGLLFRFDSKLWPDTLNRNSGNKPQWIVLKMSYPIIQGDLWYHLAAKFSDRLITLVSIENVRSKEVRIRKGISWEQTVSDLIWELNYNPSLSGLLTSRHLIIWFKSEGALWIENKGGKRSYRLVFDPAFMEGEFAGEAMRGAVGYGSIMAAGVVYSLAVNPGAENLDIPIKAALSTVRHSIKNGHGPVKDQPAIPLGALADQIDKTGSDFGTAGIPVSSEGKPERDWTIMGCRRLHSKTEPMYGPARNVARLGARALSDVPYARFGQLFTVDRSEIESYRVIRQLIIDYQGKNETKPLSIAVFGPPGAGKSFGIKQLAKGILKENFSFLEFNLSQFPEPPAGARELIGAFHQVRDKALEGKMPIVFWDEFDSKKYAWLQYLLAPMQDGKFQEGQITHPIGKCVFVFAGGTSRDFANFGPGVKNQQVYQEFQFLKGPDFISRLHGYLNVLGPNRRQKYIEKTQSWVDDETDVCFPIRRALMIRSNLKLDDHEDLKMDSGLLSALLEIGSYRHGARSLSGLLSHFQKRKRGIQRSDLPAREVMSLYLDCDEFMTIANRILTFQASADKLAPAIHGNFLLIAKKLRSVAGFTAEFNKLPDAVKADNRAAAMRIPRILELIGLYVLPKNSPSPEADSAYVNEVISLNLELLAEAEHDGWMEWRTQNGWALGALDNNNKKHPALIPYRELGEIDKEKDRDSVRNFPKVIHLAGHKIVSKIK